jgi:hypothetical protein
MTFFDESRDQLHQLRSIPLQSVLLETGAQRDRYDKAKWHTARGAISITGIKFMNWNQAIGGGGAIDLAMHLNDLDLKAAVEWLRQHFPLLHHCEPVPSRHRLTLPPSDPNKLAAVKHYLAHDRAITPHLIESLVEAGTLYADTRRNAVFLLLGKERRPVGAELRGTGSARWRGMAPGSQKDLGYFSAQHRGATMIILCESAIDTISCLLLYPRCLCVSTSGARSNPRWLPSLLSEGHVVYCGFDADSTGDKMAQEMIGLYPNIKRLRPNQHDWNDVLKMRPSLLLP